MPAKRSGTGKSAKKTPGKRAKSASAKMGYLRSSKGNKTTVSNLKSAVNRKKKK